MKSRNILDSIYEFLSKRPVYHGLFWLLLYSTMVINGLSTGADLAETIMNELINLFFYAVLVYFNLLFLVPNFLAKRAFYYFGLVLLACALVTPIKVLVFYLKYSGQPLMQSELVARQGFIFLGNVFVLFLSTVLRVIMDWWRYQGEKQTLLTQSIQSELRFLKSQINPHFLFNTLNNLYALTLKKSDKAPEIVLKLSEIMRYMLYECNERRVLLSKEIQYMMNYLDLERIRQPEGTRIETTIRGHISDQMVAPLLFVPFLENAFKHGLNHFVQGGGCVCMTIQVSGDNLEFVIENSKTEAAPRQNHPRSGGIGLVNVRQRLDLLYPGAYELAIDDEPGKYTVTLLLKMHQ
jgi:sensor histidine kinase YesM